jgi:hypothetical protein
MKILTLGLIFAGFAAAQGAPEKASPAPATPQVTSLLKIKRVYVEALAGNDSAEAIRQLIISTLQQSHLFSLTDNPDRADVTLRGAANDTAFTDTFDSDNGVSSRANGGAYSGKVNSTSTRSSSGGLFGGLSGSENDSEHIKERKHEAYATVRLCNRDGDVLWATTQESRGAKFHSASADVAEKVTRQLQADFARAAQGKETPGNAAPAPSTSGVAVPQQKVAR